MKDTDKKINRRDLLKQGVWYAGLFGIAGTLGLAAGQAESEMVWQLDPDKCIHRHQSVFMRTRCAAIVNSVPVSLNRIQMR